jgi:hypothetical protein
MRRASIDYPGRRREASDRSNPFVVLTEDASADEYSRPVLAVVSLSASVAGDEPHRRSRPQPRALVPGDRRYVERPATTSRAHPSFWSGATSRAGEKGKHVFLSAFAYRCSFPSGYHLPSRMTVNPTTLRLGTHKQHGRCGGSRAMMMTPTLLTVVDEDHLHVHDG